MHKYCRAVENKEHNRSSAIKLIKTWQNEPTFQTVSATKEYTHKETQHF